MVLVTTSDFGRTLTSNGKGTDHGWAGNQFVVGGKVKGGEIYNEFPSSLLEGNLYDVGRGRITQSCGFLFVSSLPAETTKTEPKREFCGEMPRKGCNNLIFLFLVIDRTIRTNDSPVSLGECDAAHRRVDGS